MNFCFEINAPIFRIRNIGAGRLKNAITRISANNGITDIQYDLTPVQFIMYCYRFIFNCMYMIKKLCNNGKSILN